MTFRVTSHGSAHPLSGTDGARIRDQISANTDRRYASAPPRGSLAGDDVVSSSHAAAVERAGRWRGWIERAGANAPRAPMWTSRESWLTAVSTWAHTSGFTACCEAAGVSITSSTVLAIARVMAAHADHASGRHCAVTRATIAETVGCDVQTVTRAWRLLRTAGWAVEAQRGHGSPGTPAAGRRPSVYHLVPRRSSMRTVGNVYLPPEAGFSSFTPVGSSSPRARERAEKMSLIENRPRRGRGAAPPRPLAVQQLAAVLARDCHGLDRGHIGAVCDVLIAVGVDPAHWSARAIRARLEADMRARGGTWPDRIERPAAFLASRLRRLDWQPPATAGDPTAGAVAGPERPANRPAATAATAAPATPAQRAAHRARIDTAIAAARRTRATAAFRAPGAG